MLLCKNLKDLLNFENGVALAGPDHTISLPWYAPPFDKSILTTLSAVTYWWACFFGWPALFVCLLEYKILWVTDLSEIIFFIQHRLRGHDGTELATEGGFGGGCHADGDFFSFPSAGRTGEFLVLLLSEESLQQSL